MDVAYMKTTKPYWAQQKESVPHSRMTREFVGARTRYLRYKYEMLQEIDRRDVDAHLLRLETHLALTRNEALELLFMLGLFLNEHSPC